jgi:hypothetical protein
MTARQANQRLYDYRVATNGEFIRIENGRESRTDFYFVRGGRPAS